MMNCENKNITYKENLKCSNINDLKLMFKNDIDKLYNIYLLDNDDKKTYNKVCANTVWNIFSKNNISNRSTWASYYINSHRYVVS